GLTDVEHAVVKHERVITDIAGFAHGLVYGNPIIDEIRNRGGVDPGEVVARVQKRLIERFGPEPAKMPLKITVFNCRMPV
ncbi:MAG: class I SAM-dependent methyltransferase, partial [Paracoccaceae bacterium]